MDTLSMWLRQARESQGSTIEEAAAATRIRARFLEALEAGDFATFPGGDVQVRGFLRIYARYLSLPPDEVLARYNAEVHGIGTAQPDVVGQTQPLAAARAATRPMVVQPPRPSISSARPRRLSPETLLLAAFAVIVLLAIVTAVGYLASRNGGEAAAATPTVTAPAAVVLPSAAVETPTLPTVMPTFPASPGGGVTLALEATEHVWTRVSADGRTVFEGMMSPGQVETWSGQEVVVVETGNGAGLQVTVNEQLQGAMCGRNQVCTRGWGPTGEVIVAQS